MCTFSFGKCGAGKLLTRVDNPCKNWKFQKLKTIFKVEIRYETFLFLIKERNHECHYRFSITTPLSISSLICSQMQSELPVFSRHWIYNETKVRRDWTFILIVGVSEGEVCIHCMHASSPHTRVFGTKLFWSGTSITSAQEKRRAERFEKG